MAKHTEKDRKTAALLKDLGEERMIQRCSNCYRIIACEGPKSKYTHICNKK